MIPLVLAMLLILLVAGFVVVYVAFPHRDQSVPGAPWLGDALKRGVDALPPTLEEPPAAEEDLGLTGLTGLTRHHS